MKRRALFILTLIVFVFVISSAQKHRALQVTDIAMKGQALSHVQEIFPQAASFNVDPNPVELSPVFDANKNLIGKVIFTDSSVVEQGYGGPVHFLIGIDLQGKIRGVVLTDQDESPDRIIRIREEGFLKLWNDLSVPQALAKKVDTISGATQTTGAIIRAFQKRLAFVSKNELRLRALASSPKDMAKDILLIAALLFSLFVFFRWQNAPHWNLAALAINIIILGFVSAEMLSLARFEGWIKNGIFILDPALMIALAAVLISVFMNKNFYCTLVCPFGALQNLAGHLNKKNKPLPYKISRVFYWAGLVYFSLIIGVIITGVAFNGAAVEPFAAFSIAKISFLSGSLFLIFLAAAFFWPRPWCNFFCPTGKILGGFLKKNDAIKKPPIAVFIIVASLAAFLTLAAHHQILDQNIPTDVSKTNSTFTQPVAETPVPKINFHPALYFKKIADKIVQCRLCPRQCILKDGDTGFCRARKNINGDLYALTYGQPVALHVDPIEKKPLAHVYPGTKSFSIATAGCNLRCKFCQNWEISQLDAESVKGGHVSPEQIVAKAKETGSKTIAFTYTEPTIFYEYMLDIAKIAKKEGLSCVMHSAGFINETPLRVFCPYLLAANIDLKSFDEKFYHTFTQGSLATVLNTLKILKSEGVWVEITNLIIPGVNDSDEQITAMCQWIKDNLGKETPVHFSRFYPMYKLINLSPTPVATLEKAYAIAKKVGLDFVYVGNIPDQVSEDTICPACKNLLIKRVGYSVLENRITDGHCPFCGYKVQGVW